MKPSSRQTVLATILGLAFVPAAQAQSVGDQFTTASGQTLILAPINDLKCGDIENMLARIDATRYRGNAPTPLDQADAPLFEYELSLSEENYNRCALVRKKALGGLNIMQRTKSQ